MKIQARSNNPHIRSDKNPYTSITLTAREVSPRAGATDRAEYDHDLELLTLIVRCLGSSRADHAREALREIAARK